MHYGDRRCKDESAMSVHHGNGIWIVRAEDGGPKQCYKITYKL